MKAIAVETGDNFALLQVVKAQFVDVRNKHPEQAPRTARVRSLRAFGMRRVCPRIMKNSELTEAQKNTKRVQQIIHLIFFNQFSKCKSSSAAHSLHGKTDVDIFQERVRFRNWSECSHFLHLTLYLEGSQCPGAMSREAQSLCHSSTSLHVQLQIRKNWLLIEPQSLHHHCRTAAQPNSADGDDV